MHAISRKVHLLALLMVVFLLPACGGGGSSDNATTFTVEGRVLNGVLVGSTVDVFGTSGGSVLGTATTDANGRYAAQVSRAGPYRLRATGGKLNGVDYAGTLESSCSAASGCFVTPYTTVLLRLVDDYGFNMGDGAALLANSLGFDGDPFAGTVPVEDFDLAAARAAIAGGDGLAAWVASVVAWATSETTDPPPGIAKPEPADPPLPPDDPDPAPVPGPDPDPVPDPAPVASLLLFGGEDNSVYLGCLTCNALDSESVCNSFGTYGSPFSSASIWNQFGTYGSPLLITSPWNAFSLSGPAIVGTDNVFYGYFTVNTSRFNRTTIQTFVDILDFYSTSNDLSATRSYACGN